VQGLQKSFDLFFVINNDENNNRFKIKTCHIYSIAPIPSTANSSSKTTTSTMLPPIPPLNLAFLLRPDQYGIDPLFFTNLKLFNSSIIGMKKVENCSENVLADVRPVTNAHIVGVLIAKKVESNPSRTLFVVDDGTALLDCLYWHKEDDFVPPYSLDIGILVRGLGRIELPRKTTRSGRELEQRRQLILTKYLEPVQDPNEELLHWLEVVELWETYKIPFRPGNAATLSSSASNTFKDLGKSLEPLESLELAIHDIVTHVPPMPLINASAKIPPGLRNTNLIETYFLIAELMKQSRIAEWQMAHLPMDSSSPTVAVSRAAAAAAESKLKPLVLHAVKRLVEKGHVYVVDEDEELLVFIFFLSFVFRC